MSITTETGIVIDDVYNPKQDLNISDRTSLGKFGQYPWIVYQPTSGNRVESLLKLMNPKPGDVFYDLGCGCGHVCIEVAKKFPDVTCVGVEASQQRSDRARWIVDNEGLTDRVSIRYENIFETDFSDATLIYLYLYTNVVNALVPRLNVKDGIRVFTASFHPSVPKSGYGDKTPKGCIGGGKPIYGHVLKPKRKRAGFLHEYVTPIIFPERTV